jgi:hypothetical protein
MFKKLIVASLSLILALNACGKGEDVLFERNKKTKLLFDVYIPIKTPINFLDKKLETVVGATIVYLDKPTVTFDSLKEAIPQSKCNVQRAFYYKNGKRYEISEEPINIQENVSKVGVVCEDRDNTKTEKSFSPTETVVQKIILGATLVVVTIGLAYCLFLQEENL